MNKREQSKVRRYLENDGCHSIRFFDNGNEVKYQHPSGLKIYRSCWEVLNVIEAVNQAKIRESVK